MICTPGAPLFPDGIRHPLPVHRQCYPVSSLRRASDPLARYGTRTSHLDRELVRTWGHRLIPLLVSVSFLFVQAGAVRAATGSAGATPSLSVSPNPALPGQTVTFTATVATGSSGAGTPTGTVTFSNGANVLGSTPVDSSGNASLQVSNLTEGSYSISAAYSGDSTFAPIVSTAVTLSVTPTAQPAVLHTYNAVGWHLVSSPYALNQPISMVDPHVFAWDPVSGMYTIPTDTFHFGQGYWLYLAGTSLDIPGPGNSTDNTMPLTISLGPGWNIVGEPFTGSVPLAQISVLNGAGASTPFSAATDPNAHLVSPLYTWDPSAQMYNLLNTDTQTFDPWNGAWVYAKQSGLSIVINPSLGGEMVGIQ